MDQLSSEGSLNEAGGPQYLAELSTSVPTTQTFSTIRISFLNMR